MGEVSMRTLTKTGIRILSAKYRSILKKCALLNAMVLMLGTGSAFAEDYIEKSQVRNKPYSVVSLAGAAIYNSPSSAMTNINANFISNFLSASSEMENSSAYGGAIYNNYEMQNINGNFTGNYASTSNTWGYSSAYGGAIYNMSDITSIHGDFNTNYVSASASGQLPTAYGGAIYNTANIGSITGNFVGNYAQASSTSFTKAIAYGGAIYNTGSVNILAEDNKNLKFDGNYVIGKKVAQGGAIYNTGTVGLYAKGANDTITFVGGTEDGKYDIDGIYNQATLNINGFEKSGETTRYLGEVTLNNVNGDGITNIYGGTVNVKNDAVFNQSTLNNQGIFNFNGTTGQVTNLADAETAKGTTKINAGSFTVTGNATQEAITIAEGATLTTKVDVTTSGITNDGTLNLLGGANIGKGIIRAVINSTVSGDGTTNFGTADSKAYIQTTTDKAIAQTINLVNADVIANSALGASGKGFNISDTSTLTIAANNIMADVANSGTLNLGTGTLSSAITGSGTTNINDGIVIAKGNFTQSKLNLESAEFSANKDLNVDNLSMTDSTLGLQNGSTGVLNVNTLALAGNNHLTLDADLANETMDQLNVTSVSGNGNIVISDIELLAPTTKDKISLDLFADDNTKQLLANNVSGHLNGLTYSPIYKYDALYDPTRGQVDFTRYNNGGYDDLNPAVMAGAVAAQVGGYLNQINSYENAFEHMDSYMMLSRNNRLGTSLAVKYITDAPRRAWLKPYAAFETVKLKHGPKVDNNMYGSFAGLDSAIVKLKHGWDIVYSGYASYDGSNQKYDGNSIYQNGGHLGATLSLYKGNFFTGLTANAGASSVKLSTMYGADDTTMFTTGAASKTGYDLELVQDWLIVQPSVLLSYSLVNMSDYTNAAGVKISSDALHAIQIAPELKLISNLPHGWQPYVAGKTVWNMLDETKFSASGIDLPELSTKQYVQYGVGIQKNMFNGFYGYAQAMFRNGGRDGVALNAGLKMAF